MRKAIVVAAVALGAGGMAFAAPPAGVGAGRPDFAGRPSGAGSSDSYANANSQSSSSISGARGGSGVSGGSGIAPGSSNAGGRALDHAAPQAQPTLQVLDQAFSEQEISQIRAYFTQRAFEHKKSDTVAASATTFHKGDQLPPSADAQPLSAELLAQLPSRPGLTYVQVGDSILLLAGPKDVIVDIIPNVSSGG